MSVTTTVRENRSDRRPAVTPLREMVRFRLPSRRQVLLGVFVVLMACQGIMAIDLIADVFYLDIYIPWFDHALMETLAVLAMSVGLIAVGLIVREQFRENRRWRNAVETASGRLLKIMDAKFEEWKLTASERDVALLLIKGLSVAEIAQVRDARPGTVKSQCNAIYRKAGLKGRSELAAYFMEDLLAGEYLLAASAPSHSAMTMEREAA